MCVRGREREGERERESGRERERERERNGYRDNVSGVIAIGFVSIQSSSQSVVTDTEDCVKGGTQHSVVALSTLVTHIITVVLEVLEGGAMIFVEDQV